LQKSHYHTRHPYRRNRTRRRFVFAIVLVVFFVNTIVLVVFFAVAIVIVVFFVFTIVLVVFLVFAIVLVVFFEVAIVLVVFFVISTKHSVLPALHVFASIKITNHSDTFKQLDYVNEVTYFLTVT